MMHSAVQEDCSHAQKQAESVREDCSHAQKLQGATASEIPFYRS